MKRFLALLSVMALLCTVLPAAIAESADGEEEEQVTISAEQLAELEALDAEDEDEPNYVVGATYYEPCLSDFNRNSPAIYTCKVLANSSMYKVREAANETRLTKIDNGVTCDVLSVGANWAVIRWSGHIGYIKRQRIHSVTPLDPVNTVPYGVQKSIYLAKAGSPCHIRKSMSDQDECWLDLNPGTLLTVWRIQDGWAIFPFKRSYGYVNMNELTDLISVSPTDTPISDDSPIAAYTSYYNMAQTETNIGRIENIRVACTRLTRVMQPGEKLNFNKQVGPFRKGNGYQSAPVLINGETVIGSGGGTCQVSSTLYNALLQLPGITIEYRRPHGPGGASYLPHGVDAAVGSDTLNLIFKNSYPFPIRVEGHSSGDGALCMVIYRVD